MNNQLDAALCVLFMSVGTRTLIFGVRAALIARRQPQPRVLENDYATIDSLRRARTRALRRLLAQTGRLIVGVPDYDLYLTHMGRLHPDTPPMTREAFFANRLEARYGRGASRCC